MNASWDIEIVRAGRSRPSSMPSTPSDFSQTGDPVFCVYTFRKSSELLPRAYCDADVYPEACCREVAVRPGILDVHRWIPGRRREPLTLHVNVNLLIPRCLSLQ